MIVVAILVTLAAVALVAAACSGFFLAVGALANLSIPKGGLHEFWGVFLSVLCLFAVLGVLAASIFVASIAWGAV